VDFTVLSIVKSVFSRRTLTKYGTALHLPSRVILGGSHCAGNCKSGSEYNV
jgi:hypothetical protein